MTNIPETFIKQIEAVLKWLKELENEEILMKDSINMDHPSFKGSEEEKCWAMHERNLLHIELARRHLQDSLWRYFNEGTSKYT